MQRCFVCSRGSLREADVLPGPMESLLDSRLGGSGRAKLSRLELEFLAPALEVTETPPSPLGRTIAYAIMIIAVTGICWATIGHVDIV
jgi:hemolysin D